MMKRSVCAIAAFWLAIGTCFGQAYPAKPIRILTAGAGGGNDILARIIAQELSTRQGVPVIVDNRPSNLLAGLLVSSAPDGYTLMVWSTAIWTQTLMEKKGYDPQKDIAYISLLTVAPQLLSVHPTLPVKSLPELIAYAKARPGQLNYSTGGDWGGTHVAAELLKSLAGIDIVRVPYKSSAQELTDQIAGVVQVSFSSGASIGPTIRAGKLRALAVTSGKPSVLFPDLPTIGQTFPGYKLEQMLSLYAPARTPLDVLQKLNREAVEIVRRPDVREKLLKVGLETVGSSIQELEETMRSDRKIIAGLMKASGVKLVD